VVFHWKVAGQQKSTLGGPHRPRSGLIIRRASNQRTGPSFKIPCYPGERASHRITRPLCTAVCGVGAAATGAIINLCAAGVVFSFPKLWLLGPCMHITIHFNRSYSTHRTFTMASCDVLSDIRALRAVCMDLFRSEGRSPVDVIMLPMDCERGMWNELISHALATPPFT